MIRSNKNFATMFLASALSAIGIETERGYSDMGRKFHRSGKSPKVAKKNARAKKERRRRMAAASRKANWS